MSPTIYKLRATSSPPCKWISRISTLWRRLWIVAFLSRVVDFMKFWRISCRSSAKSSPSSYKLGVCTMLIMHNAVNRKCVQYQSAIFGYRERDSPSIEEIFAMSDDQLFSKINSNSVHLLQQFLPDRPSLNYSLRARPHNKTLIAKTAQLNDQDFIIRSK